jgi:manganese oxidase
MMKQMRIVCLLIGLILSVALIGCTKSMKSGGNDVMPAAGQGSAMPRNRVAMLEFHFRPESLNVTTGDTVTWVNDGNFPHTVTSGVNGKPDGLWDTKHLAKGESFSYVFTKPGTYDYFCRPHNGLGMKGVVVVTDRN